MWHLGTILDSLFLLFPRSSTICILVCLIIWGARFTRTHIYRRSSRLLIIKLQFSPILTLKELSLFTMSEFYRFWCVWSYGMEWAEYSLLCLLQVSIKSAEYLNAVTLTHLSADINPPYGVNILNAENDDCRVLSLKIDIWTFYCNICTDLPAD